MSQSLKAEVKGHKKITVPFEQGYPGEDPVVEICIEVRPIRGAK